jgi:hypothetical protein
MLEVRTGATTLPRRKIAADPASIAAIVVGISGGRGD